MVEKVKRIMIIMPQKLYDEVTKVRHNNNHKWDQVLPAYIKAYKKRE
ncbi:unnamed protein product [marine sediment metagenome]|uniref:Uncharacterized protein n=1 Tax=marine sediment metagenome TaxID=412755 RepID=X1BRF5_9ZZZZ